uniref:Uncharacterized protein n=1 Tax=Helianthus annuus TaxID=4232 RepID=A0A251UYM4_HELAN
MFLKALSKVQSRTHVRIGPKIISNGNSKTQYQVVKSQTSNHKFYLLLVINRKSHHRRQSIITHGFSPNCTIGRGCIIAFKKNGPSNLWIPEKRIWPIILWV